MSCHLRRRSGEKAQRHSAPQAKEDAAPVEIVRETTHVERLASTRTQAAEALGISRSTFNRRVLPVVETVEMPWGTRLIPVDELERLIVERRRSAQARLRQPAPRGRPPALPPELIQRVLAEHAAGRSLRQIADGLNASRTSTAHGGTQWWPSTVRAVLRRKAPAESARD